MPLAPILFNRLWALRSSSFHDPAVSALLSERIQRQMRRCTISTSAARPSHEHMMAEHASKKNAQPPASNVGVFWDFENCAMPMESIATRLTALYRLAQTLGRKTTFKVYMDHEHAGATAARLALCSGGLELIDCPHGGMKEVADKTIMLNMFEYALDNPAPSSIVLISGDHGYIPMLSRLSWRGYRVVIIAPAATQNGFKLQLAQCHAVYDWSDELTLLHNEEFVRSTQPSGNLAVQHQSAVSSTSLCTSKKLPEKKGYFSPAPKPAVNEKPKAKTMNTHGSTQDTSVTLSCKPIITAVKPMFQTLVNILAVRQKLDGAIYVSISELGRLLRKTDPNVYKEAGVSGTRKYAELAEKEHVVVFQTDNSGLVKVGHEIFIGLHPRLLSS
ncbi:hypothetical protein DAEQUDRAFT_411966 [Daedalea quercina L-15889]|uniref:NYN domain-containing protein n=1 Tax=Daedalea quercina L-15889 TaxID=1314783 RepID=A0A165NLD8_9APHY|nr:hypothetical protein DAEQUDRAFT_411966 [Daedalea quercina L-15889]